MKQKLLNNFKLRATLLVALLCTAFTGAWADDAYYTLDTTGSTQTNNNGYANTGTVTVDGIGWSFNGNGQINPWRLGGKSLTEVDRAAYTTTAMGAAINRIELTVGAASGITVNSLTLIVASDASFGTVLDEVEEDFEASSTITFEPTSGSSWATGSYYKFVFNVTVSGSSNKFVQFSKVEFYEYTGGGGGSSAVATTTAIDASGITNTDIYAGTEAGTLSATVSAGETIINNATITWSGNNDAVATIDASTGAVTLVAAGSVTFTATYAGVENTYNPSSKTYVMTVTSSDPNAPGTENNPYTVAQAREAIDAGTGVTGVYATGIVSAIVTAYNSTYGNISYNISADGSTNSDQLQAYRGKSYNGDNFTSEDDIQVGDVVVVYGNLKKYSSTYEFDADNQLVSLDRPVVTTPTITVSPTSLTGFTYLVENGPSEAQKVTISGSNLTDKITAALDDNSNFEFSFSEDGEYFTDNISIGADQTLSVYVRMKAGLATGEYAGSITLTSEGAESVSVALAGSVTAPEAPNMTWDLSTNSYDEVTDEDVVTWSSNYATMTNSSGSGTKASNYLGGDANKRTSSRFYSGNSLTITPGLGYEITSIIFEATSANYASVLASSTWTNASADANGTTVTVTPTDGSTDIFATIGGTCGFTSVKVYYQELSDYAPIWSTLPAPIVSVDELYEFYPSTYVSAMPAPTSITLETLAPSDSYDYQEGYFIFNYNTPGVYAFTFTATNPEGSSNATLTITVEAATVTPSITLPQYEYGVNADGGDAELPLTCNNLANEPQLTVMFFEADGTTPAQYDWISASINGNGNIAGHMEPNTGDARTAYFKVAGMDAEQNWIYSDLVTINQEAYTGPSITMSKSSIDFEIGGGSKTLSIESVSLGSNPSFDVQFFESDGVTTTECGWIYYQFDPNDNKVTITGIPNDEGVARTAYFKVYTEVNKTLIYSNLVAVNQAGPDYATLPFNWDGGRADIEDTDGLTQEGLDTDYSSSPKLKFNGNNDVVVLKINERPGTLTFDIKGNSFKDGTFKVQTSEDGTTYTDLKTYTELGDTQNESFNNLGENVRYIKWIYTTKVSGNVALGNITLATYVAPSTEPSIDLGYSDINVTAAGTDGVIIVDYKNITNVVAKVQFLEADGTTPATYDYSWVETQINEINNLVYVIDENTSSEARTAYLKIYALDDESNIVYSDLITINQEGYVAPVPATTYSLAKSITAGKHYLIVGSNSKTQEYYAMGLQNNNNRSATAVSVNNGQISITDENVAEVVVYGPDASGNYTIYNAGTGYLYAASSSSNHLKSQSNNDLNGKWSIIIDGEGIASVEAQGDNTHNVMQFNSGNTLFSCYGSASQSSVSFYEKDNDDSEAYTANVTLNAFGYATFASNYALDFLDNEDANYSAWQIAEVNDNTNTITFEQITGMVAPATGILLKGKASDVVALNVLPAGGATLGDNKLVGITESTQVGDNQYFGLKGNEFVKVNTGVVPAGKALLPIDNPTAGVKSFTLIFNDADGIQTIETVSAEKAQAIFNLAGQRLPKAQKGINIINGKKVLVK